MQPGYRRNNSVTRTESRLEEKETVQIKGSREIQSFFYINFSALQNFPIIYLWNVTRVKIASCNMLIIEIPTFFLFFLVSSREPNVWYVISYRRKIIARRVSFLVKRFSSEFRSSEHPFERSRYFPSRSQYFIGWKISELFSVHESPDASTDIWFSLKGACRSTETKRWKSSNILLVKFNSEGSLKAEVFDDPFACCEEKSSFTSQQERWEKGEKKKKVSPQLQSG